MNKNQYRLKTQIYIYILKEHYSSLRFLSKCPCKITTWMITLFSYWSESPSYSFSEYDLKSEQVEKHWGGKVLHHTKVRIRNGNRHRKNSEATSAYCTEMHPCAEGAK